MIFVTGPLFAGKREYIMKALGLTEQELAERAVWDVQNLAFGTAYLSELADSFAEKEIVIATEVGAGVVPVNAGERAFREAAERLACLLAQRAGVVIRVCCGLPQVLKGDWTC